MPRPKRELVSDEPEPLSGLAYARLALGDHDNLVYVLGDPESQSAAVIDPAWDVPRILDLLDRWDMTLMASLFTHNHPDHTQGAKAIHAATGCDLYIHDADASALQGTVPVRPLADQTELHLGEHAIIAHHTPGHTAGGVTYQSGKRLFTGDFLFIDTAGRTDFPTGSKKTLWASLQRFKTTFPDDHVICPGHDYGKEPEATLGDQKRDNPALAHTDYDDFEKEWFLVAY